ncbi:MAG: UDP-N-acetylmuramoyl-L-alanyl-D-glutamate--2,6-diaminopimelate ligase [Deltaproteobacteria bacterium]|nr:UDP-N-acetylmuramoyl-L-alanyl-D-glutamate--2,6-diaminopimelate ligase [Deltaproteobacteria bacterium]
MELSLLKPHPRIVRSRLNNPRYNLESLHCDSRLCGPRTAFLALKGLKSDGHAYIGEALRAGTPVLFVSDAGWFERLESGAIPGASGLEGLFLVDQGRLALAELAAELQGHPSRELNLFAVTGTNGKTTVTHLVDQLLEALGESCGIIGTRGMLLSGGREGEKAAFGSKSGRTTPEAPELQSFLRECAGRGVTNVAMEASSIGLHMRRSHGLRYRAVAFTNLSQDHLDYHLSWEAYREAKYRLFLEEDTGRAVLNLDDPAGRDLMQRIAVERISLPVLCYGLETVGGLSARNIRSDGTGQRGMLHWHGEFQPFRLNMPGLFNISNLLAAVGLLLGEPGQAGAHPLEALAAAAESCRGARGRFERVELDRPFTVVVDYAHSPHALENLLAAARPLVSGGGGRLVLVFGAGGGRDREKRPLMGRAARQGADRVILTSDNPRNEDPDAILEQIAAGMNGTGINGAMDCEIIPDRREAIHQALDAARPGDVVLIAGKGDETYQEVGGERLPFDDREEIRRWDRGG